MLFWNNYKTDINLYYTKSEFAEGLAYIEKLQSTANLNFYESMELYIWKLKFFEKLGKFTESLLFSEELITDPQIQTIPLYYVQILVERIKIFYLQGDLDLMFLVIEKAEDEIYKILDFSDKEFQRSLADLVLLKGGYFWQRGELENALYNFKFNYQIRLQLENKLDLANALNNVGVIYNALGDLQNALFYFEKAYKAYTDLKNLRGISKTGSNLGALYIQLGELNKSKEYMEHSLNIDQSTSYSDGIRSSLQNLGEIAWHEGDYKKAFDYLSKSLQMSKETENPLNISEILVPFIAVALESGEILQVNQNITLLRDIAFSNKNDLIQQRLLLCEALLNRSIGTPEKVVIAEKQLKTIVSDQVRYHDTSILALVNLCEILCQKLTFPIDLEIIQEIRNYIEFLIKSAKKTHSFAILIEVYLLKARLSFYEFHFEEALDDLKRVHNFAVTLKHHRLEAKILAEYDIFLAEKVEWEKSPERIPSEFQKSQLQKLNFQLKNIFSPAREINTGKNEEVPYFYSLLQKTGETIMKVSLHETWDTDSLFFHAFQIELSQCFKEFRLKRTKLFQKGIYKIIFQELPDFISLYVFIGPSYIAFQSLKSLTKNIAKNQEVIKELYSKMRLRDTHKEINPTNLGSVNKGFYFLLKSLSKPF